MCVLWVQREVVFLNACLQRRAARPRGVRTEATQPRGGRELSLDLSDSIPGHFVSYLWLVTCHVTGKSWPLERNLSRESWWGSQMPLG